MASSSFDFEQGQRPNPEPFIITQVANEDEFSVLSDLVERTMKFTTRRYELVGELDEGRVLEPGEDVNLLNVPRWRDWFSLFHNRPHFEGVHHLGHELLELIPDDVMSKHDKFLTQFGLITHDILRIPQVGMHVETRGQTELRQYIRTYRNYGDEHQSGLIAAKLLENYGFSFRDQRFVYSLIQASLPKFDLDYGTVRSGLDPRRMDVAQLVMSIADLDLPGRSTAAQNSAGDALFLEAFRPDCIPHILDPSIPFEGLQDDVAIRYKGFLHDQVTYIKGRERYFMQHELPAVSRLGAVTIESLFTEFDASANGVLETEHELVELSDNHDGTIDLEVFRDHHRKNLEKRLNHHVRPLVFAA